MNTEVNSMLNEVSFYQTYNVAISCYDDAKVASVAYAITGGSSSKYHSNHGGLPNIKEHRKYITLSDGGGYDNYIACFVRDTYQGSGDKTYGKYWQSYFGTYYASAD